MHETGGAGYGDFSVDCCGICPWHYRCYQAQPVELLSACCYAVTLGSGHGTRATFCRSSRLHALPEVYGTLWLSSGSETSQGRPQDSAEWWQTRQRKDILGGHPWRPGKRQARSKTTADCDSWIEVGVPKHNSKTTLQTEKKWLILRCLWLPIKSENDKMKMGKRVREEDALQWAEGVFAQSTLRVTNLRENSISEDGTLSENSLRSCLLFEAQGRKRIKTPH